MQDLMWQLKDIDALSVYITLLFAGAVFWFIREIIDAPMLAVFSLPALVIGGLLVPAFFRSEVIVLTPDQEANAAATCALGVLGALILMVAGKWLWLVYKERQVQRTKLAALQSQVFPEQPPSQ
ncbi:hypothetical protein DLM45_09965 [Hyphomicrobium methylovorum]|uniref:hypothetical protein n=1 Tax=Hyphomicrobium methylovorum TaxID=84 RepID=UPI0015E70D18|nr:hypothetical protein [Hyphomicrobium methylovorum]MBA2126543.1 hypothetical protein [Hyphomicrobium methylovorum]